MGSSPRREKKWPGFCASGETRRAGGRRECRGRECHNDTPRPLVWHSGRGYCMDKSCSRFGAENSTGHPLLGQAALPHLTPFVWREDRRGGREWRCLQFLRELACSDPPRMASLPAFPFLPDQTALCLTLVCAALQCS